MTTIEKIEAKLANSPELSYQATDDHIAIAPPTEAGFTDWLTVPPPGFTVGFDGWHEEFDCKDEALNAFAFGSSERCRLKVTQRCDSDGAWVVEWREEEAWHEDSTTALVFTRFCRTKSVEYRQNCVINEPDDAPNALTRNGRS